MDERTRNLTILFANSTLNVDRQLYSTLTARPTTEVALHNLPARQPLLAPRPVRATGAMQRSCLRPHNTLNRGPDLSNTLRRWDNRSSHHSLRRG